MIFIIILLNGNSGDAEINRDTVFRFQRRNVDFGQKGLNQFKSKYIYGFHVIAQRSAHIQVLPMLVVS